MKFWELISAFRTETENLVSVFQKDCWKKYRDHYTHWDEIIARQDRKILDKEIPFDLAREVCALSKLQFYLYYQHKPYCLSSYKRDTGQAYEELSPLEILIRFGGSFIEEVLEKGTAAVMPREIGDNIEVLAVYKLTNIGMMAFLRLENNFLKRDDVITSTDNLRQWVILEEPFTMISPFEAYEKRERQKEQGIRLYKIQPLNGSGKPKETEILKHYNSTKK